MRNRNALRLIIAALVAAPLLMGPAWAGQAAKATRAPALPASAGVGETVRVTPAVWPGPAKRKYQWLLNGKLIAGVSTSSLKLSQRMDGGQIRVRELATLAKGKSGTAVSNTLTVGRLSIIGEPVVAFVTGSSSQLGVALPTIAPAPTATRFVWLRDGFDIGGATGETYTLTLADKGTAISVQVSFTRDGYMGKTMTSNAVDVANTATQYKLLWSDEFNQPAGTLPDAKYWVAQEGDGRSYPPGAGWGNAERQYYLADLAKQDGAGNLDITATRTGASSYQCWYNSACEWVSSKYVTQDKLGMKYGRIEVRMKGAPGVGTWPAFWLLGIDFPINTVRWPRCGELDVVELLGRDPLTVYGTTHGPLSGGTGRGGTAFLLNEFSKEFHVYGMDWTENQITFTLDGKPYKSINRSDGDWVFDHEFFLLLNLAMGGNWGGTVDAGLNSTDMLVDYVRIYSIDGVGQVITH
jgi:beta-glucanase (GH16 family)